jgi:NAD(P)-dependent dehydrogenase (short-subunit alcohol dehydrogenase family)
VFYTLGIIRVLFAEDATHRIHPFSAAAVTSGERHASKWQREKAGDDSQLESPQLMNVFGTNEPKRFCLVLFGQALAWIDLWRNRPWDGSSAYGESKLYDVMLAFAVARLWRKVLSNALTPGWVATKMGGAGAPDDISQGHLTQAWLAVSDEPAARTSGGYFYHLQQREPNPQARDVALQDRLIAICREISGIDLPRD